MSCDRRAAFEFGRTNRRIMPPELGAENLQGGRKRRRRKGREEEVEEEAAAEEEASLEAACSQSLHP